MTVDEYISKYPEDVQKKLNQIRNLAKKLEPEAKDTFSYGAPALEADNRIFIFYAAFKNHIGIYPSSIVIESFKKELEDYETSKSTIKFPHNESLPLPLLEKIIEACLGQEYTAIE